MHPGRLLREDCPALPKQTLHQRKGCSLGVQVGVPRGSIRIVCLMPNLQGVPSLHAARNAAIFNSHVPLPSESPSTIVLSPSLNGKKFRVQSTCDKGSQKKKEGETVVKAINGSKKGLALAAVAQLVECCLDSPLGHLPGCGRSIPCRGTYGRQPIDLSPYPSVYKKKILERSYFFPIAPWT